VSKLFSMLVVQFKEKPEALSVVQFEEKQEALSVVQFNEKPETLLHAKFEEKQEANCWKNQLICNHYHIFHMINNTSISFDQNIQGMINFVFCMAPMLPSWYQIASKGVAMQNVQG